MTRDVACAEIADWSCGVVCGRQYSCGNHLCQAPCHRVAYDEEEEEMEEEGVEDQEEDEEEDYDEEMVLPAGVNCGECERSCAFSRPQGCTHPCSIGKNFNLHCTIPVRTYGSKIHFATYVCGGSN